MVLVFALTACGGQGGGSGGGAVAPDEPIVDSDGISDISISVGSGTLETNTSTAVTVVLYAENGDRVQDSKTVLFSLDPPSMASIASSATTDFDGQATVTLNTRDIAGTVALTATVGSVQRKIDIEIVQPSALKVAQLSLVPSATNVGTNGTVTVNVALYGTSGQIITDRKTVSFTIDKPAFASVTPSVTTTTGEATAVLTTRNEEGQVVLNATVDDVTAQNTIVISNQSTAGSIALTASPATLTVGGTTLVSARVLKANGDPMPDGTLVNFSVSNPDLGEVVGSSYIMGGNGVAQSTFKANMVMGTARVSATTGSVSSQILLEIAPADAGSIEFLSAEPQVVVIKGQGGIETSLIKFLVKDINGFPVGGSQAVFLDLSGPNGGEYIGPTPNVKSLEVSTVNGEASTYLHSGTIPGTATVTATVVGTNIKTSSGVIAIGGGVPSAAHFSLSATRLNLEGLAYDGITSDINVKLADRYGNYNVLAGTAVSFYTESGAIDRAVNLNEVGEGSVVFRTQRPFPQDVPVQDPAIDPYENWLAGQFSQKLGVSFGANNPRDGLCTIIAVVDGEEKFIDNGNGIYDSGDTFFDTYDDIHLDKDDDPLNVISANVRSGYPHDSTFEDLIVDKNKNGAFNGMNTVWDANKRIAEQIKLLITGAPDFISVGDGAGNSYSQGDEIVIPDGGRKTIYFSIHDVNFNPPTAYSKFILSTGLFVGLRGNLEHEYANPTNFGSPIFSVEVYDPSPGSTSETIGTLNFDWTWAKDESEEYRTYRFALPVKLEAKPVSP
jgi:hypothetical protein